jgi:hypothetical protein
MIMPPCDWPLANLCSFILQSLEVQNDPQYGTEILHFVNLYMDARNVGHGSTRCQHVINYNKYFM